MNVDPIGVRVLQSKNYELQRQTRECRIVEEPPKSDSFEKTSTISFKGDKGAFWGVIGGALTGATIAAITVATGGLAAVVAAVGTTGTIVGGAAAGTHLGGIIGGLTSDD